ncbi:FHA domain-containing protein [Kribbella jiaozuonensis]|uniref:FHA domain-containing protein n=1 Tax=Kribbella jiaozuonensis TaxID=2575441 RepID=A0A4V5UY90_9ACTN|nr:FHA domain-containing protein [Kribbella jiaozuonensis]TKK82483.1 FHA domain-containing protein [Kribbella jiaozuonensis]
METEFVLSLGEQRWTLPAEADTITIGRASNADIRLQADDQISRIHARLSRDGTTWTLHDESRNGTGLNGHRITAPTALTTGDRIHIGRSVLTFHKSTIPDPVTPASGQPDDSYAAGPQPSGYATGAESGGYAAGAESGGYAAAPEPGEYAAEAEPGGYAAEAEPRAYPADAEQADVRAAAPQPPAPAAPPTASSWPAAAPPAPAGGAPGRAFPPAEEPWSADEAAGGGERYDEPVNRAEAEPYRADQGGAGGEEYGEPAGRAEGAEYRGDQGAVDGQRYGEPVGRASAADGGERYGEPVNRGEAAEYPADQGGGGGEEYGEPAYQGDAAEYRDDQDAGGGRQYGEAAYEADEYGAAGVVPGFEVEDRVGDGGWAAYPSADNPEPVRTPREISARVEQAEPNWNTSDSWPEPSRAQPERRLPGADRRTNADRRANPDRRTNADRLPGDRRTNADRLTDGDGRTAGFEGDAVGTVRLPRVLIVAAGIIVLGLIVNLIVTFLADGPGGELRWLVPPGIALVVAMVLALLDAAAPKDHPPGRFDVSILIAIAVVLVGVGVGGFALTAGTQYVGGYLTGNESGEDRLVKPVAKPSSAVTITVENVTYTSHFTRVEVMLANGAKEPVTIPIAGATFTAADGTALRADTRRSNWPSKVAAGGTEHGTITFKGKLPDSADAAVLTLKSGDTAFTVSVALSN